MPRQLFAFQTWQQKFYEYEWRAEQTTTLSIVTTEHNVQGTRQRAEPLIKQGRSKGVHSNRHKFLLNELLRVEEAGLMSLRTVDKLKTK